MSSPEGKSHEEMVHEHRVEGGKKAAATKMERYGEIPGLEKAQQASAERSHEDKSEAAKKAAETRTGRAAGDE